MTRTDAEFLSRLALAIILAILDEKVKDPSSLIGDMELLINKHYPKA